MGRLDGFQSHAALHHANQRLLACAFPPHLLKLFLVRDDTSLFAFGSGLTVGHHVFQGPRLQLVVTVRSQASAQLPPACAVQRRGEPSRSSDFRLNSMSVRMKFSQAVIRGHYRPIMSRIQLKGGQC